MRRVGKFARQHHLPVQRSAGNVNNRVGGIIALAFMAGVAAGAVITDQRAVAVFGADVRACMALSNEPQARTACVGQLAEQYAVGSGGGQLSNLLKLSLKLRSMGFKPSKQYLDELQAAMKYRPNQLPLIDALKDTIAYQQKLKAQMEILSSAQSQQGAAMGAGAAPGPGSPANVVATPPPATAPPMPPMP
jgi:uncharacterized protein (DUF1778 family)